VLTQGKFALLQPWVEFKEMPNIPLTFHQISIRVEGDWKAIWAVPN
jgi:hypothetical protein